MKILSTPLFIYKHSDNNMYLFRNDKYLQSELFANFAREIKLINFHKSIFMVYDGV